MDATSSGNVATGNIPSKTKKNSKKKKYAPIKKVAVQAAPVSNGHEIQNVVQIPNISVISTPIESKKSTQLSTGYYGMLIETKRVETLCRSFSLQYHHLVRLRHLFNSEDVFHSGEITIDEFFHLIGETKRTLTLGIFAHVGLPSDIKRLCFDDFILCIVIFASMSRREMLSYVFSLFNQDGSGIMDSHELQELCSNLKNNGFYFQNNVKIAQNKLQSREDPENQDGLLDFDDLNQKTTHFSAAFYPILQYQRKIQSATLGEALWLRLCTKKEQIEKIVQYMTTHQGHVPKLTISQQITAYMWRIMAVLSHGVVGKNNMHFLYQTAVKKYEERLMLQETHE